jgi:hypothetical protein
LATGAPLKCDRCGDVIEGKAEWTRAGATDIATDRLFTVCTPCYAVTGPVWCPPWEMYDYDPQ